MGNGETIWSWTPGLVYILQITEAYLVEEVEQPVMYFAGDRCYVWYFCDKNFKLIWADAAKKESKDKRLDLALNRLHGKISNLQDKVENLSRELQDWI